MTRRVWFGILGLNLGILIATSPVDYSSSYGAKPVAVTLSPESPVIYVDGVVDAGQAYDWLELRLAFDGVNEASASGQISMWMLGENEDVPAQGAQPVGAVTVDAQVGGEHPVTFDLSTVIERSSFGPFHLMLSLEGEAVLEGDLTVLVFSNSTEGGDGLWVKVEELEVYEGMAP